MSLTDAQREYFATLAKLDPSPDMARVIEEAEIDLAEHPRPCLPYDEDMPCGPRCGAVPFDECCEFVSKPPKHER